ncbi:T9SS type A sorting domain-containing protein [candidate division WOR-3 bacterium]|nr:T9SS type A sorting domain-containing protein [candidate division WOR-3 bacterium]
MNVHLNDIDICIEGTLRAIGAVNDSILFRHYEDNPWHIGGLFIHNNLDSLCYCSLLGGWGNRLSIIAYNSELWASNSRFEETGGISGNKANFHLTQCEFLNMIPQGVKLDTGKLYVDDCSFIRIFIEFSGYYEFGGIIHCENLDTCSVTNSEITEAGGGWTTWEGFCAAGLNCVNCFYVEFTNSIINDLRGGDGDSGPGVGGSGGDGCGVYLEHCDKILVRNNELDGIGGGDGEWASMYGGNGGWGFGVYLRDCDNALVEMNQISRIWGGSPGCGPEGDGYPGKPLPLVCTNSSPQITNNEFNSPGRYISIDGTSQPVIGGSEGNGNRFLNASDRDYVIYNNSYYDIDATWNFWECGTDMIDSLIFDYYDDPTKGIVYYDNATDVEEEAEPAKEAVTLSSNIVDDVLHVQFSLPQGQTAKLDIIDVAGRKAHSEIVTGMTAEVDLSSLSAGVYFVKTGIGEREVVKKKIVLR